MESELERFSFPILFIIGEKSKMGRASVIWRNATERRNIMEDRGDNVGKLFEILYYRANGLEKKKITISNFDLNKPPMRSIRKD